MPTRYILLWVERPSADAKYDAQQAYQMLLGSIQSIKLAGGTSRAIREGVWLLERESDTRFLAHVVVQAEDRRLKVEWLFLAKD